MRRSRKQRSTPCARPSAGAARSAPPRGKSARPIGSIWPGLSMHGAAGGKRTRRHNREQRAASPFVVLLSRWNTTRFLTGCGSKLFAQAFPQAVSISESRHWCRGASASPILANFQFALRRAFKRFDSPPVADAIKKARWPHGQWRLLAARQIDGIANHSLQRSSRGIIDAPRKAGSEKDLWIRRGEVLVRTERERQQRSVSGQARAPAGARDAAERCRAERRSPSEAQADREKPRALARPSAALPAPDSCVHENQDSAARRRSVSRSRAHGEAHVTTGDGAVAAPTSPSTRAYAARRRSTLGGEL